MAVSTRSQGGKLYIPAPDKKKTRRRTRPAPAPAPAPALLPAAPPAPPPARSPNPRKNYVDKGVTADLSPRKAKSPKTKTLPPPGGVSKNYVDKGVTADLSPRKTKNPKAKTPPPAGGISKNGAGSKQKTPPPSPVDPSLVKRRGRLVRNNEQVIPTGVLDGRAVKRFPPTVSTRSRGLWNRGFFCYRNATIQALLHVPAFYRYMGKMHKDCRHGPTRCVTCALQDLAHIYWNRPERMQVNPGSRVAGPLNAVRNLDTVCLRNLPQGLRGEELREDFLNGDQSDAWEFLRYLLEDIQDRVSPRDDVDFLSTMTFAMEDSWTCEGCGRTSTIESQDDGMEIAIDLDIRNPSRGLTLVEYLDRHFNHSPIQLWCDENECVVDRFILDDMPVRQRVRRMKKMPDVLIIRLQRFAARFEKDRTGVKVTDDVPYDEYLNVGPFTTAGEDMFYRLDSVVAHRGRLVNEGHYIAAVREPGGTTFLVADDDSFVGRTPNGRGTFRELQYPNSRELLANPYILIYSKV